MRLYGRDAERDEKYYHYGMNRGYFLG